MTSTQFEIFSDFRNEFSAYCKELNEKYSELLKPLQLAARLKDTPDYPLENALVYNTALDEITQDSDIRLIVIGDNPGKDEQREINKKYLVGQSGKIALGFFEKHPDFQTDFRKNVIILNKTPVHTAKTSHLKSLAKEGGQEIKKLLDESQIFMAEKTAALHQDLCRASSGESPLPELWLVGYGELKGKKGIFLPYKSTLKQAYENNPAAWDKVFVFQHFSMNRFSIDLKNHMARNKGLGVVEAAHDLGNIHKKEIFG